MGGGRLREVVAHGGSTVYAFTFILLLMINQKVILNCELISGLQIPCSFA